MYLNMRKYIVERCLHPVSLIYLNRRSTVPIDPAVVMRRINSWSDVELEEFFERFVIQLSEGYPTGELLLFGVEDKEAERRRLHHSVALLRRRRRDLQNRLLAESASPSADDLDQPSNERPRSSAAAERHLMLDPLSVARAALSQPPLVGASSDRSREGALAERMRTRRGCDALAQPRDAAIGCTA